MKDAPYFLFAYLLLKEHTAFCTILSIVFWQL